MEKGWLIVNTNTVFPLPVTRVVAFFEVLVFNSAVTIVSGLFGVNAGLVLFESLCITAVGILLMTVAGILSGLVAAGPKLPFPMGVLGFVAAGFFGIVIALIAIVDEPFGTAHTAMIAMHIVTMGIWYKVTLSCFDGCLSWK